jgi:hypothetical protein
MLADRVNVIEGIVQDLAHGHIPNLISERGLKAEWKYNKKACIMKAGAITATAIALYLLRKRKKSIDRIN